MEYGTKVHECLETLDFTNPALENIPANIAPKITKFLEWDLIKENKNAAFYKEYEFIYEEDNTLEHGIIDLLIDCGTHLIIVDYKLKNIFDEAYDKQLNGYSRIISSLTNKPVSCYLYSITDSISRKVM